MEKSSHGSEATLVLDHKLWKPDQKAFWVSRIGTLQKYLVEDFRLL